jgi:hypothetical protein
MARERFPKWRSTINRTRKKRCDHHGAPIKPFKVTFTAARRVKSKAKAGADLQSPDRI